MTVKPKKHLSMFEPERTRLDHYRQLLADEDLDAAHLREEMAALVNAHEKLIRQVDKITRVGDSNHRKLVHANEEIRAKKEELEILNHNLLVTRERLVMKEKLAALGTLTSGVAHEIRNPLNFINSLSQISVELTRDLGGKLEALVEPGREGWRDIERDLFDLKRGSEVIVQYGQRAEQIVANMCLLSQSGDGEPQPTDLGALLEQYARLARGEFEKKRGLSDLVIKRRFKNDLPRVAVVPRDVGCVIIQLVLNALESLQAAEKKAGGKRRSQLILGTRETDDSVLLLIGDDGVGIPPENEERIFTPFFTTKPTGCGNVGLGLTISYNIVAQSCRGEIDFLREDDKTIFRIVIPKDGSDEGPGHETESR